MAYKLRPIQVEASRYVTYEHGKANHSEDNLRQRKMFFFQPVPKGNIECHVYPVILELDPTQKLPGFVKMMMFLSIKAQT